MQNRRKYQRLMIEGLDVQCKMLFATEVKLLNISFSGSSLQINRRLNMGSEYTLYIERKNKQISLKGVVVWEKLGKLQKNEKGEMAPVYEVGLQFMDVLTDRGKKVIAFIQENFVPKQTTARLSGVRLDILEYEKGTTADLHRSYEVIKISIGGMLIGTEERLEAEHTFTMELNLPESNEPIKFLGRIASCLENPNKTPNPYETGIEFIEMNNQDKSKLEDFINSIENLNK